jgi:hypothetical protein
MGRCQISLAFPLHIPFQIPCFGVRFLHLLEGGHSMQRSRSNQRPFPRLFSSDIPGISPSPIEDDKTQQSWFLVVQIAPACFSGRSLPALASSDETSAIRRNDVQTMRNCSFVVTRESLKNTIVSLLDSAWEGRKFGRLGGNLGDWAEIWEVGRKFGRLGGNLGDWAVGRKFEGPSIWLFQDGRRWFN